MQTKGQQLGGRRGKNPAAYAALLALIIAVSPVQAAELTSQQAALYTTVSIFPPSTASMTVCYSFGCRVGRIAKPNLPLGRSVRSAKQFKAG